LTRNLDALLNVEIRVPHKSGISHEILVVRMSETEPVRGDSESSAGRRLVQVSSSQSNLWLARVAVYAAVFTIIQRLHQSLGGVPLTVESLVFSAIGGVAAAAWLLGALSVHLQTSRRGKLLLLWPSLFVIQLFADLIEGAVFTTKISSGTIFLGGTLVGAGITFAESLGVILVFPSSPGWTSPWRLPSPSFR
jgi:hypothetical protein